jgi:hypothetical protein
MDRNLKNLIEDSKKIRALRGEDFFGNKNDGVGLTVQFQENPKKQDNVQEGFRKVRDSHVILSNLIKEYDKKIVEQNDLGLVAQKPRSKSIHLYIDEKIEKFLNDERKRADTWWGLRKNAGLGGLIQKFIEDYMKIKKREEIQIQKIRKIISEFRVELVAYKKKSSDPDLYVETERHNQRMRTLSSEMIIYISMMGFDEITLERYLEVDFKFIDLIIRWKI